MKPKTSQSAMVVPQPVMQYPGAHAYACTLKSQSGSSENVTRSDLQRLALMRVADADVLLDAGRWPAGYYLLGYAVECALKACAARRFQEHTVPEKTVVNDFYTHRLDRILQISGVKDALEAREDADPAFRKNWGIVHAWNEASRYDHSLTESAARDMLDAVMNPTTGILTWVRTQW